MQFGNFQKPLPKEESGCKIKVNRDNQGRITSIKSNGRCNKSELDVFRENIKTEVSEENN